MRLKFLILAIFLGAGSAALAVSPSAISVSVSPQNPAPNENVTISLSSYAANLGTVNISWIINGKSALSGIGKSSFQITAGAAGSETRIIAKIFLPDGEIDKNIIIRPAELVLLFEATDSYLPPFYKGKALPTADSEIKVVAMPEIKIGSALASPKTLTYEWKKDYSNSPGDSGYGRIFLIYSNDYLDEASNISVVASTIDGKYSSGGNINIGSYQPQIAFYKKDSALGTLWEKALPNPYRISGEETVVAAPYFISPRDIRRPELVFKWFINNLMLPVKNYEKNLIPIRAQGGASGVSKLRLEIENRDKIFESASREINIEF